MVANIFLSIRKHGKFKIIAFLACINIAFVLWLSTSRTSHSSRWIRNRYLTTMDKRRTNLSMINPTRSVIHPSNLLVKSMNVSTLKNDSKFFAMSLAPHIDKEIVNMASNACPNILSGMSRGRWVTRNLTDVERAKVDRYLVDERGALHIPSTYQRVDGRCGDLPYEKSPLYKHMWFKAICNPKGSTPCCKQNKCVSSPMEHCQCAECYDERSAIHAEFAKWQPDNTNCEPHNYSTTEACRLLKGSNISFVGDSFIRHVFAALVILLTGNANDGALRPNILPYQRERCSGWHQVTGLICRELLIDKRSLCQGTVQVDYTQVFPAKQLPLALPVLQTHSLNATKSLIIFGLGIHDDFRIHDVTNLFLKPFLNIHQFWRSRSKDIDTVVTAMKNFKSRIHSDVGHSLDLFLNNNNYLNSIGRKLYNNGSNSNNIFYNSIMNDYNNFTNFTFDLASIMKMKDNLNVTLKEFVKRKEVISHQPVSSNSSEIPQLVLSNSNSNSNISKSKLFSKNVKYPNLLWVGIHAPGLLKSSKYPRQTHAGVSSFNQEIYKFLKPWGVPYLDTFSFSNGTVSFDGTHYGWGINMLKVNMILTYIERTLKPQVWDV